jgi:hypothetical protein
MATNGSKGGGRIGAVKGRSQVQNPVTGIYTKRNTETGQFMDGKKDGQPFKGVRKEK